MLHCYVQSLLESMSAEIAFALHARASQDEMRELASEFQSLIDETSLKTPNIDTLKAYVT